MNEIIEKKDSESLKIFLESLPESKFWMAMGQIHRAGNFNRDVFCASFLKAISENPRIWQSLKTVKEYLAPTPEKPETEEEEEKGLIAGLYGLHHYEWD